MVRNAFTILLAALVAATGCRNVNAAVPAEEQEQVKPVLCADGYLPEVHLPDTAYPSVAKFQVKIVKHDTITPGVVPIEDMYKSSPNVLMFRKGLARDAAFGGKVQGRPSSISVEWTFRTEIDTHMSNVGKSWGGGTGWTGQPLYVEWPDSIASMLKADTTTAAKLTSNKEIIVSSLAGSVYFIDFETGTASRKPVCVYHPIKGTPMIDPTFNGLMYVGNGVKVDTAHSWGQVLVDLFKQQAVDLFPVDRTAWRSWGAYDSSPFRMGDFVFHPGENGTLYKWIIEGRGRRLHSTMQYRLGGGAPGMEASMCVWRNYGYVGDNHGHVMCINLDNLQPVWCYDIGDDIDSTPVLSLEHGRTYIYSGCEVDRTAGRNLAYFVKLDALDGSLVWENVSTARRFSIGNSHFDGGYYCTPLLGAGNCEDLLFVNRVLNLDFQDGEFVAIDKKTGNDVYSVHFKRYAWSSPVALFNESGEMFVVTADTCGYVYLIDGRTGEVLCRTLVGLNFESSPIVVGDRVIVGSRGQCIYCMKIS